MPLILRLRPAAAMPSLLQVAKPVGDFKNSGEYQYQQLRVNVDMLKLIQVWPSRLLGRCRRQPNAHAAHSRATAAKAPGLLAEFSTSTLRKYQRRACLAPTYICRPAAPLKALFYADAERVPLSA